MAQNVDRFDHPTQRTMLPPPPSLVFCPEKKMPGFSSMLIIWTKKPRLVNYGSHGQISNLFQKISLYGLYIFSVSLMLILIVFLSYLLASLRQIIILLNCMFKWVQFWYQWKDNSNRCHLNHIFCFNVMLHKSMHTKLFLECLSLFPMPHSMKADYRWALETNGLLGLDLKDHVSSLEFAHATAMPTDRFDHEAGVIQEDITLKFLTVCMLFSIHFYGMLMYLCQPPGLVRVNTCAHTYFLA